MSILMTVEELAKYLKIKPDTIYKKVRKGELPAIKLGKLVRFPKELIDEWIVEQATKTMKEVRAAKKAVEHAVEDAVETVETAVETVETAVEDAVGQVKKQAENAFDEVRRTQGTLTDSIKNIWNGLGLPGTTPTRSKKIKAKSGATKKKTKTVTKKTATKKAVKKHRAAAAAAN